MTPALRAVVEKYLIDPSLDRAESRHALAFVDLEACDDIAQLDSLPPFPVIGIGERNHPLAATLDAVLESPIDAATLIAQVERAPRAAAITVQLLRTSEGLSLDRALVLESWAYGLLQGSAEYAAWLSARRPPAPPELNGRVIVEREGAVLRVVIDRPHA